MSEEQLYLFEGCEGQVDSANLTRKYLQERLEKTVVVNKIESGVIKYDRNGIPVLHLKYEYELFRSLEEGDRMIFRGESLELIIDNIESLRE